MKFSLTITDATKDEITAFLNGGSSIQTADVAAKLAAITHSHAVQHAMNNPGNMIANGQMTATTQPNGSVTLHTANGEDDNAPTNTNAPAVDAAGLPHDVRIHSDNKGLNKDGTWRKRRGAQDATVAAVEAELKMRAGIIPGQYQQNAQPQFTPPSNVMPMPAQPQFTPPMPDQQYQQPQPQMQMPPQQFQQPIFNPPGQPQTVQFQQPPAAMDFNAFMMQLSGQMQKRDKDGTPVIHTDYLANVCQRLSAQFQRQFNSITDIASDPNAINAAVAFINADGRWN